MIAMTPTHAPLAYKNEAFLDSDDARPLRILAEYLEPMQAFRRERVRDTIVFFGSARLTSDGPLGHYYAEARGARASRHRVVEEPALVVPIDTSSARAAAAASWKPPTAARPMRAASTIGLNIGLPHEQRPNPYITRELSFQFHYFFMRKLWFAHLARALVAFPGGFGTLDELTELLTLMQTRKIDRPIPIVLYGSAYWNEIINFDALVRHGMIAREDLDLFKFADDPVSAFGLLEAALAPEPEPKPAVAEPSTPAFAHSQTPPESGTTDT